MRIAKILKFFVYSNFFIAAIQANNLAALEAPLPIARVAFTPFPPWCFKSASGDYQGIFADYIHDLAAAIGLRLREEDIPIGRLHRSLQVGKLDIFFSNPPDKGYDCCVSLGKIYDGETVVVGKRVGPAWHAERQEGSTVCRTQLSGYQIPGMTMYDAGSLATCVRMLAGDRLPFIVAERHSLQSVIQAESSDVAKLFSEPTVIAKRSMHFYMNKSYDQSKLGPSIRDFVKRTNFQVYIDRYSKSR